MQRTSLNVTAVQEVIEVRGAIVQSADGLNRNRFRQARLKYTKLSGVRRCAHVLIPRLDSGTAYYFYPKTLLWRDRKASDHQSSGNDLCFKRRKKLALAAVDLLWMKVFIPTTVQ
jgi:hypothetical protein